MPIILDWGISVIAAIQIVRTPVLDHFFITMSALGSEYFYFAVLPVICMLINRKMGISMSLAILASVMINVLLKTSIAEPRPFILDPSVGVIPETGYSFPSGHTQQAALFWGLMMLYMRQWWVTVIGAFFIISIALSRMYLGVHYPTDIVGALVIAALVLYFHQLLVKSEMNYWVPPTRYFVFGVVLFVAAAGCYLAPVEEMISTAGLASGLVGGLLFVASPLAELPSSWCGRFIIAIMTGVIFSLTYVALQLVLPGEESAYFQLFSFIKYFLCGFVFNALPVNLQKFSN